MYSETIPERQMQKKPESVLADFSRCIEKPESENGRIATISSSIEVSKRASRVESRKMKIPPEWLPTKRGKNQCE